MSDIAIKVENLGKLYRLGEVGTGTLSHDLNRWIAKVRGKEDPFAKIGEVNDRTKKGASDYVWALRDVNFEVKQGEVVGIIGRNGAGKSTLLKLLSKVTKPTTGRMKVKGRIASLLEVGTGFHPEMTGRENIFLNGAILGMTKREIRAKFDEIVDFAGVERYVDTPVKRYSSGMYVRLAFAVAAHLEPEILIVDEVLAVGDAEFQKKCLGKMKDVSVNDGRTVLFVSHNMGAVSSLCSKAIFMQDGQLYREGQTDAMVKLYLQQGIVSAIKPNKILEEVRIEQSGEDIILEAKYNLTEPIDIPNLGFVVFSPQGFPLFGGNPLGDSYRPSPEKKYQSGKIRVCISAPKLLDGDYTVSIWFGDSRKNFLYLPEALGLSVVNMVKGRPDMGLIIPTCEWEF